MKKLSLFLLAAFFASSHAPSWSAEPNQPASSTDSSNVSPPLAPQTHWQSTQTLSLISHEDGTYQLKLESTDWSGKKVLRQWVGTRQEIKESIGKDTKLTETDRDYVCTKLDQHFDYQSPTTGLPWLENLGRELLNWSGYRMSAAASSLRVPLR